MQTHKTRDTVSAWHGGEETIDLDQFYFLQFKAQWLIMEAHFMRTVSLNEKQN